MEISNLTANEIMTSLAFLSYILVLGLVVVSFKEKLEDPGYVTGLNVFWFVIAFIFSPVLMIGFMVMAVIAAVIHLFEYISKVLNKPLFYKKTVD